MNRLQKGLIGIVLPGLMVVSGCGGILSAKSMRLGGHECVDRSKSHYATDIEKEADELAQSSNLKDIESAMIGYGDIGQLEKMDKIVRKIIEEDFRTGLIYSGFGDEYHKMHKKDKK